MGKGDRRSSIAALVGVIALTALVLTSWQAVSAALDERAYAVAPPCGAAAATGDCRQVADGTVLGVTEIGGRNAEYRLDVGTGDGSVEVGFPSDNAVLASAVDGSPVSLTFWRGRVVSVSGRGGSAEPADAPRVRFASLLGDALLALGCADYGLLVASLPWLTRRYGRGGIVGRDAGGPHVVARGFMFVLVSIGGLVPLVAGMVEVSSGPQSTVPVLVGAGAALCVVLVLAWRLATGGRRRSAGRVRDRAPVRTVPVAEPRTRTSLRFRLRRPVSGGSRPAPLLPKLPRPAFEQSRWFGWLVPVLGGGGLAAVLLATGPVISAHAYRTAPPCVNQVVTADCRGVVAMTVNGVRTPAGAGWPAVSLATADGSVNTWADFGDGPFVQRAARLQSSGTVLDVHVWRARVVGVDLDGATDWAVDGPPDGTLGLAALGLALGLFVLLNRAWARRRNPSGATAVRRFLAEDAAQSGLIALGLWLLDEGFVWALLPLLAAPVWSLLCVRQVWVRERARGYVPVLPGHAEREPVLMSRTLAERFAELADGPLLLEPRDRGTELRVNEARLGPEALEDPAAGDLPSLLEGLSEALRDRLAAVGRGGPASFYACLPAEGADLYCGTTSRTRAQTLQTLESGPVRLLPVDSAAELVAHWRERVTENLDDDVPDTPVPIWLAEVG